MPKRVGVFQLSGSILRIFDKEVFQSPTAYWIRTFGEVGILQHMIRGLGVFHTVCIEGDDP